MDLMPSPEEEQIIDTARALLSKELPVDFARWEKGAAAAPDRALLLSFAELGWIALGLPEDAGGFGFGATEEMLLFREAGRALVTPMLMAAVIAARLAAAKGDAESLAALVSGMQKVGFAIPSGDGSSHYIIDGEDADRILLIATDRVALLSAQNFGDRAAVASVDGAVTLERATLAEDGVALSVEGDEARVLLRHLSLLIAATLVGAAEAVRDLTVAHASERTQFGQKIGSFQAVSHPCADMAVRCEAALSQAKLAAVTLRDGRADASFQVQAARIVAIEAAIANASAAIQLHGGMGFAAEYPIHFFLKRAHLLDQIGGAAAGQLDALFALDAL
jgi:alkylation response protein AidB-like acyl-CoA dehydrogenase